MFAHLTSPNKFGRVLCPTASKSDEKPHKPPPLGSNMIKPCVFHRDHCYTALTLRSIGNGLRKSERKQKKSIINYSRPLYLLPVTSELLMVADTPVI